MDSFAEAEGLGNSISKDYPKKSSPKSLAASEEASAIIFLAI